MVTALKTQISQFSKASVDLVPNTLEWMPSVAVGIRTGDLLSLDHIPLCPVMIKNKQQKNGNYKVCFYFC
jgi:hypothetical protein